MGLRLRVQIKASCKGRQDKPFWKNGINIAYICKLDVIFPDKIRP